jgi:hypothetical protein
MRVRLRRVPRKQVGTALLVAAFVLASIAASLRFFATSSDPATGGATVGLTPAAGASGAASRNASKAGSGSPGSASGQPTPGTGGHGRASAAATIPPPVNIAGAAALPSAHVHAGYDTPEDAVDGFYLALLSGTPTRACAYVANPCPSFGSRPITGFVTVLDAVTDGGQGLVEVTGSICVGPSCVPLLDRIMLPTGPASFSTSWTSLISGIYGWAASPLPCVQDAATKQWRVKLR